MTRLTLYELLTRFLSIMRIYRSATKKLKISLHSFKSLILLKALIYREMITAKPTISFVPPKFFLLRHKKTNPSTRPVYFPSQQAKPTNYL